ncbi:cya1 [Symbiodinium necroappetens]|uniref:Cya1 protein n=1 Tax=Symbiodinium necroappetens TaxID=1628268 RepID=A0A812Y809_9DINO|nr:cya1 [Symbiodinium necroappetens]
MRVQQLRAANTEDVGTVTCMISTCRQGSLLGLAITPLVAKPHRASGNDELPNVFLKLSSFEGGKLWVEDNMILFNAKEALHMTMPWKGTSILPMGSTWLPCTEKLELPSTDANVAAIKWLRSRLPDQPLQGWVLGERRAYRQIPISPAHRKWSVVALKDPAAGKVAFFAMIGHSLVGVRGLQPPFGSNHRHPSAVFTVAAFNFYDDKSMMTRAFALAEQVHWWLGNFEGSLNVRGFSVLGEDRVLGAQARQISPALALERTDLLAAEATRTCCVLSRLVDDCDELPLLEGNRPFFGRPVGEGQGKQKRQRQIKKVQDSVAWFSTTLLQPLRSLVDDMVAMSSLELVGIDDHTAPGTGMLSSKTSKDKIKTAEELENLNTAFRAMRSAIRSWSLFVPPSVVERFYDAGLEVTVLFCDIEGFEETCREMDPDAVLSKLTGVLGTIADEIQLQNGTFLEFISDEVMAVFNAPNKLPNHARCAVRFCNTLHVGMRLPPAKAFISKSILPYCEVCYSLLILLVMGGAVAAAAYQAAALRNIGSHQRIKYGLLGDGVNLAARMKGLNTRYGTCTLCSQNALSAQQIPLNLATRPVDLVAVKGKSEPTKVCEVIGFMNEHPSLAEAVKRHQLAFDLYLARKFKEAMEKFEEDAHGPTNTPEAVRLNVGACSQEYMKNPPPPEWVASSLAVLQHVGGYNANSLSWTVAVGKALAQRPLMPPVSWAIRSAYRGRPSELKAKRTRQNFWEAGPRAPGVGFDSCLWHLEGRHLDTTRFGVPQRQKNQIKENIIGNAQQENDAKLAQANGILPAESVESHVLQVEDGDGKDDGSSAKRPCGAGCAWQSTFCQSPEVLRLKGDQSSQIRVKTDGAASGMVGI